jgi:CRISPR/Cas system CSM-associated protein Csm3 (group 7 of RAMP superfamily)
METNRINYTITFLSDWHAGSGLSSGADADAVVIKDKNNLPYLPGKTIKGLLKGVFKDIEEVQPNLLPENFVKSYFGEYADKKKPSDAGSLFFSNAELNQNEQSQISKEMTEFLYRNIASTAIDENGVAQKNSLRVMEVCIPLQLNGYIDGVNKADVEAFRKAFACLRNLGSNRNRGLGRCKIEIKTN